MSIENVDAAYHGVVKVLHDINISIPRGRTVSIVGESGSGKSTVARVITGLLPPSTGGVRFNNEDLPASAKNRSVDQKKTHSDDLPDGGYCHESKADSL